MQPWCWAKDFKGSMKLFASHCGPQIYRRVWEKDQLYDKRTLAPRTEKLMWFPDEPGGGKWLAVRFTGNQTHKNIANGFAPPDNFHVWSHYNHKCPFLFFFFSCKRNHKKCGVHYYSTNKSFRCSFFFSSKTLEDQCSSLATAYLLNLSLDFD